MKKVCIITGSRAEYGLLCQLMHGISNSKNLDLQIIATGMHMSHEFGMTYKQIEKDGFKIDKKLEILLSSDSPVGVSKSIGLGAISFSETLNDLKPELLVVLGDRFEILSASIAALISRIPVAHIHGGELTEGSIDESIRHSITKMSHLHFVSHEVYKNRVIQLGEDPKKVFNVGALGIDNIKNLTLLDKETLQKSMKFVFGKRNLLVTFHPVTLENQSSKRHIEELLFAVNKIEDTSIIFTMPNADTDGRIIFEMIEKFVEKKSNLKAFKSLGQLKYLSCLKYVDAVIGNSSSGIIEVPTFKKPTINIGERQRGRLKADSVIDCDSDRFSIEKALKKAFSTKFQSTLKDIVNPYGDGGAADRIIDILEKVSLPGITKKKFYDIEVK